jgi:hypothetical protein
MDEKGGRGGDRGGGGRYRHFFCLEDHFDESNLTGVMTTAAVIVIAMETVIVIAMETAIAAAKFSFLFSTGLGGVNKLYPPGLELTNFGDTPVSDFI